MIATTQESFEIHVIVDLLFANRNSGKLSGITSQPNKKARLEHNSSNVNPSTSPLQVTMATEVEIDDSLYRYCIQSL